MDRPQPCAFTHRPPDEGEWIEYADYLEQQLANLRGALHEIYSKACRVRESYDDVGYYQFAAEARDIALNAHKAHTEDMLALQGGEKDD